MLSQKMITNHDLWFEPIYWLVIWDQISPKSWISSIQSLSTLTAYWTHPLWTYFQLPKYILTHKQRQTIHIENIKIYHQIALYLKQGTNIDGIHACKSEIYAFEISLGPLFLFRKNFQHLIFFLQKTLKPLHFFLRKKILVPT